MVYCPQYHRPRLVLQALVAERPVALPPATAERTPNMALKHWLDRGSIVLLLAFVVLTVILGTATFWLGLR